MRIAIIGAGYVGLVTGACLSEFGFEVRCVDSDASRVARLQCGKMPIFEPGLQSLVARNIAAGRLGFGTDLAPAMRGAAAVFIAVGTPSRRGDGHADISYVLEAAKQVAELMEPRTVIVTKSTVPVGTGRQVAELIRRTRPDVEFSMVSNPEFLREGSAIDDFMRPDRVIIGTEDDHGREVMAAVYRPLYLRETPIVFTNIETAELSKYAANAFLATKITFINEMADLAEKVGANVHDVARAIGLDKRIGPKFLHPGPGFGGSCFPKDTLALVKTGIDAGAPTRIVEAVVSVNEKRKREMAERIVRACGGSVDGRRIAILGVTFKPNTDDMRDAPSLVILPALLEKGAGVQAYDPQGMEAAAAMLPGVDWAGNAYEAVTGADAVVILTEWNEFRALQLGRLREAMRAPVMIDLRNIYDPASVRAAGFIYSSVGRP